MMGVYTSVLGLEVVWVWESDNILKLKLKEFADRLDVGCERKRRIKNESKFGASETGNKDFKMSGLVRMGIRNSFTYVGNDS